MSLLASIIYLHNLFRIFILRVVKRLYSFNVLGHLTICPNTLKLYNLTRRFYIQKFPFFWMVSGCYREFGVSKRMIDNIHYKIEV